jgi:small subunit ribosomal protein S8e
VKILCFPLARLGISRDSFHKRRATGGKKAQIRKKRKYELGRPPSNTKVNKYLIKYNL